MRPGVYTACLHDKPLPEALRTIPDLGLSSAEVNSGGFLPAAHLPVAEVRASGTARSEYLGLFEDAGVTLTALNCNGNHAPNPVTNGWRRVVVGQAHPYIAAATTGAAVEVTP